MKKILLALFLIGLISYSNGQQYKNLKLTISAGIGSGLYISLEPSIRVSDRFSIHGRFESGINLALSSSIRSFSISGQYYFSQKNPTPKFMPFIGFGLGSFAYSSIYDTCCNTPEQIGFYPRIGFDSRHFTLAVDVNLINKFTETNWYRPYNTTQVDASYTTIKLGLTLGGGKKTKEE